MIMKKLLSIIALLALLGLASCNEEWADENETNTGNVNSEITPDVDMDDNLDSNTDIAE